MKLLAGVIGVLMLIVGFIVTGQTYGWIGQATHSTTQAITGPLLAGVGVALLWVTIIGNKT